VTLAEIRSAIPKSLHEKNTLKGLAYVLRDVLSAVVVYKLGWMIDPFSRSLVEDFKLAPIVGTLVNWSSWALYWYCQGVILSAWWLMAHEAGHGTLSSYNWVNHLIGFILHTVRTHFSIK
jgi:fatty acid desaturase